jgi:hypothetical protein
MASCRPSAGGSAPGNGCGQDSRSRAVCVVLGEKSGYAAPVTWADDAAAASPLSAHLVWPSAGDEEDEEVEDWDDGAPPVRGFLVGQLPGDQSDGVWEDEQPGSQNGGGDRPADPPDDSPDYEGFVLPGCTSSADFDQALDEEAPPPSGTDDPTSVATRPVPLAGERETVDLAPEQRARHRRSRIVMVAAAVVALVIGTADYVGKLARAEDQPARRPTSTSLERQPAATTGTTATTPASPDAAPDISEPAPASSTAPGSAAPASRQGAPKGTASSQTGAPATGAAGASSPPPTANDGPASPPSPPATPPTTAPNPICEITPTLCP